jgi:acetate kinase
MNDAIIVINAGSSSLKFSLYGVSDDAPSALARGQIEGIGRSPRFKVKDPDGHVLADASVAHASGSFGHPEAFAHVSQWVSDHFAAGYSAAGVGHRIVHGGFRLPHRRRDRIAGQRARRA